MLSAALPAPGWSFSICGVCCQVAGVLTGDSSMLGAALSSDTIVEVARGPLIPGFAAVKAAALGAGAYGCTISGAGPTVVAIAPDMQAGERIAQAMVAAFRKEGPLEVNYAGVAQLCAGGAREYVKGDEVGAPGCVKRIV